MRTNHITGLDNLKKTVRRLSIHRSLTSIRVSETRCSNLYPVLRRLPVGNRPQFADRDSPGVERVVDQYLETGHLLGFE